MTRPGRDPSQPVGLAGSRGLTLVEVILAVSTLAVIVLLLAGTLRVALRAWESGQRRADSQQELRAVVELLTEALAAAYPYRGRLGESPERVVLFVGEPEEVRFVTTAEPLALDAPAAPFHAVTVARADTDRLRVVERLVPAQEPFGEGPEAVLSRSVTVFRLQYLDETGAWLDRWDGRTAAALPSAVRVELAVRIGARVQGVPSFVVPLALGKRAA